MSSPRAPFRVGLGYDVHPFAPGRPLVLGGVEIPFERGLAGHSDADVIAHAVADSILGAAGKPDIGHFFPDTDPALRGLDSQEILRRAAAEARAAGWEIANVDIAVIAEVPKIAPFKAAMQERMAGSLGIAPTQIGLKATTHEGIGALGRGEGIAAHAVCLLWGGGKSH